MTTDELKRAFDICLDTHGCTDCPLLELERQNGCDCRHNLFVSAIDLATKQEREIERLKEECEQLRNEKWDAQDDLDCYCDEMPTRINKAVQDFAGKIKDYINNKVEDEYGDMSDSVNYITIDIDEFETFIDNILEVQDGENKS